MYGEKIQIHVKTPYAQLSNVLIHTINGHKLSFSQKEPVPIVAACCHSNRAHFIQEFQYNQFWFDIQIDLIQLHGLGRALERKFPISTENLQLFYRFRKNKQNYFVCLQVGACLANNVLNQYKSRTWIFAGLYSNGRRKNEPENIRN